jgi:nitroreductase
VEVIDAIVQRRTIRSFKPEPLAQEVLDEILEAATWAPSHRNAQPWQFAIVGPDSRRKLLGMLQKKIDEMLATREMPEPARRGQMSLKDDFGGAPHLIAVISQPPEEEIDRFEFPLSAAMAIQNMALAAWARGVGTVWLSIGAAPPARQILAIEDGFTGVAVVALGYPKVVPPALPREPFSSRLRELP